MYTLFVNHSTKPALKARNFICFRLAKMKHFLALARRAMKVTIKIKSANEHSKKERNDYIVFVQRQNSSKLSAGQS